jgi:histone H3/H4
MNDVLVFRPQETIREQLDQELAHLPKRRCIKAAHQQQGAAARSGMDASDEEMQPAVEELQSQVYKSWRSLRGFEKQAKGTRVGRNR